MGRIGADLSNYGELNLSDFTSVKNEFLNMVPVLGVAYDSFVGKNVITMTLPALSEMARRFMIDNNLTLTARLVRYKGNRNKFLLKTLRSKYGVAYRQDLWPDIPHQLDSTHHRYDVGSSAYGLCIGFNSNHSNIANHDIEKVFGETMWPVFAGKTNYLRDTSDAIFHYVRKRTIGFRANSSSMQYDDSYMKYYLCIVLSRRGNPDGCHIISDVSDRPIFVRVSLYNNPSRTSYTLTAKTDNDYYSSYAENEGLVNAGSASNARVINIIEMAP